MRQSSTSADAPGPRARQVCVVRMKSSSTTTTTTTIKKNHKKQILFLSFFSPIIIFMFHGRPPESLAVLYNYKPQTVYSQMMHVVPQFT